MSLNNKLKFLIPKKISNTRFQTHQSDVFKWLYRMYHLVVDVISHEEYGNIETFDPRINLLLDIENIK